MGDTLEQTALNFLAANVPVTDYQLELFAQQVLFCFLYQVMELDPKIEFSALMTSLEGLS